MSERRKRVEKMRDGRSNQSERVTTFPLQAQLVRSGNQPTMASFQRYFSFYFFPFYFSTMASFQRYFPFYFQTNLQFLAKYSLWVENKSICQIFCCTFYWNAISLRFWWFLISGNFDFNQEDPLKDCFCYIFTQI